MFGNFPFGNNPFGNGQMGSVKGVFLTETIKIIVRLNIKFRNILGNLWSRMARPSSSWTKIARATSNWVRIHKDH